MTTKTRSPLATHGWAPLLVSLLAAAPMSNAQSSESEFITWSCTGTNCPWGDPLTGQALVWPESIGAVNNRLGYSTSKGIYLPAAVANGQTIQVTSGTATAYIGAPDEASHRPLGTINAGSSLQIAGLASHEVLSVQSGGSFAYELVAATQPTEPPPPPPPPPEEPPAEEPPPEEPPPEEPAPPVQNPVSSFLTWTCTGSPCPWGSSLTGSALVWPADSGATNIRLGYSVSGNIYLPASRANGTIVWINSGAASLYAGLPGGSSHRFIANVNAGDFFEVSGLLETEVLSVQSGSEFSYQISLGEPDTSPTTPPPSPPAPSTPPPSGEPGVVMNSVPAQWHCNIPECNNPNWVAQVINWPSWSSYANNARTGQNSKTVYSDSGEVLYPYMGSWANGCEVTALSGTVLIIEWQRGTDIWRETYLTAGQTHVISLTSPENGAMLETFDNGPAFSVSLKNCTPQPL